MTLILENKPLSKLFSSELIDVQTALKKLGHLTGEIDGIFGPQTLQAWTDWKRANHLGELTLIGPASWKLIQEQAAAVKGRVHNFATKQGTIDAIRYKANSHGLTLKTQHAYIIATVHHETAQTFRPLEEYGKGKGRSYGKPDPRTGKTYYGRGFVQLTWKENYEKYSQILGVDLVNNPGLACDPNVALFVLVHGFKWGTFTGACLEIYLNSARTDFVGARHCINGTDRAHHIAQLAQAYLKDLR